MKNKKGNIVYTIILILLLFFSMSLAMLNLDVPVANAQTASTVPSNLLQYEWVSVQGGTGGSAHFSTGPAPDSPDVLWKKTMSLGTNPIAFNGLFFVTSGALIVAMDPMTGNTVYTINMPNLITGRAFTPNYIFKIDSTHLGALISTGAIVNSTTLMPSLWTFCAFNANNGALLWTMDTQTTSAVYKMLYVEEEKMCYRALGNTTGRGGSQNPGVVQAWSFTDLSKPPTLAWTYIGDGSVQEVGFFSYGEGRLFINDAEPHQTCLDAKTGQVLWVTQLTGAPAYSGSYYNGVLYKGCLDNTFIALDGKTGNLLWSFKPGPYGFWCSGTAVAYGIVYELNVDGYLYALNTTNGKVVWKYEGPNQYYPGFVAAADGKVYATTGTRIAGPLTPWNARSETTCLDALTGQIIWQVPIEFLGNGAGPADRMAIAYGNFYGIESDTNTIYCFGKTQDWTMFGKDPAHTAIGYGGPMNLTQKWMFHTEGAVISSPAVVADKVYIGSYDKNWYCLDAKTGVKIWNFSTGFYIRSSPAVANGKMYTGADDGFIYCLDANTGNKLWQTAAPGKVISVTTSTYPEWRSSPNVVNGKVYVGSLDGKLYCLNADSGAQLWTIQTTGGIISTPTYIEGDGLYFASLDGFVYKVNPISGSIIWNVSTPIGLEYAMQSSPCVGNGMLVIGSGAAGQSIAKRGQMYCLNATTGQSIWTYTQQNYVLQYFTSQPNLQPIWTAIYLNLPGIGPSFVFGDFYHMTCVNASNGKMIWTSYLTREHFGLPSYADGKIYVPSDTFGIYVINASSGVKLDYFEAGAMVRSSPAVYESKVYFGCLNWNVYCLSQIMTGTTYYGESQSAPTTSPAPTSEPLTAAAIAQKVIDSLPTYPTVPTANEIAALIADSLPSGVSADEVAQRVVASLPSNPTAAQIAQEITNQLTTNQTLTAQTTTIILIAGIAIAIAIGIVNLLLLRKRK